MKQLAGELRAIEGELIKLDAMATDNNERLYGLLSQVIRLTQLLAQMADRMPDFD